MFIYTLPGSKGFSGRNQNQVEITPPAHLPDLLASHQKPSLAPKCCSDSESVYFVWKKERRVEKQLIQIGGQFPKISEKLLLSSKFFDFQIIKYSEISWTYCIFNCPSKWLLTIFVLSGHISKKKMLFYAYFWKYLGKILNTGVVTMSSACLSVRVCVWCVLKLSRCNLYTDTVLCVCGYLGPTVSEFVRDLWIPWHSLLIPKC